MIAKKRKVFILIVGIFVIAGAVWWYFSPGGEGGSPVQLSPLPSVPATPVAGRLFAIEADYLVVAPSSNDAPVTIQISSETRYRFAESNGTFALHDRTDLQLGDQVVATVVNENDPEQAFEVTVYPADQGA